MPTRQTNPECRCLICGDYSAREQLDAVDLDLIETVRKENWTVAVIADGDPVGWAFTIGLWHNYSRPELVMFGLDPRTMGRCLNGMGALFAQGVPAVTADGMKPVAHGWEGIYCGAAMGFYRDSAGAVPFLQMLWPDQDDRFPGQSGCARHCEEGQPRLWLPYEEQPAAWTQPLQSFRTVPGIPMTGGEIRRAK